MSEFDKALLIKCMICDKEHHISCFSEDVKSYQRGGKVQDCFPYLSADDRELVKSQICGRCYDKLFKE